LHYQLCLQPAAQAACAARFPHAGGRRKIWATSRSAGVIPLSASVMNNTTSASWMADFLPDNEFLRLNSAEPTDRGCLPALLCVDRCRRYPRYRSVYRSTQLLPQVDHGLFLETNIYHARRSPGRRLNRVLFPTIGSPYQGYYRLRHLFFLRLRFRCIGSACKHPAVNWCGEVSVVVGDVDETMG